MFNRMKISFEKTKVQYIVENMLYSKSIKLMLEEM